MLKLCVAASAPGQLAATEGKAPLVGTADGTVAACFAVGWIAVTASAELQFACSSCCTVPLAVCVATAATAGAEL